MVQTPDKPLVSVVTATFNALPELKMTIPNIAGQDFRSVEHIIIDGGSSDGTAEYLAGLGGAVRWLSEPDGGIGDALNKGIAMARGEYVLVLQAEDRFCDPGSLRAAAAELAGGEDIVAFEVDLLFADGSVRRRRSRPGSAAPRARGARCPTAIRSGQRHAGATPVTEPGQLPHGPRHLDTALQTRHGRRTGPRTTSPRNHGCAVRPAASRRAERHPGRMPPRAGSGLR